MLSNKNIFILKGKLQNYDWGGYTFLPDLLGFANEEHVPIAEYWMGAHNSAPSMLIDNEQEFPLNELIKENPQKFLGKKVNADFGELPYLFKILDVNKMLSIQVHPTKSEAEKGFAAEEKKNIPLTAKNRNYKDKNHKPEVMIALSEFWLLHGFLTEDKLRRVLADTQEFRPLQPYLENDGIRGLYQYVMELPDLEADAILKPLVHRLLANKTTDKSLPAYWVQKLFADIAPDKLTHFDKGIFSIYFFNIVQAKKGEVIFQSAGLPHAYLEGQNVELMANSDNVLRGGLTSKHVDVPELLQHTKFVGINAEPLQPILNGAEKVYNCPVPDFGISEISLKEEEIASFQAQSLEILIVLKGSCKCTSDGHELMLSRGMSMLILPQSPYSLTTQEDLVVYKSFVP